MEKKDPWTLSSSGRQGGGGACAGEPGPRRGARGRQGESDTVCPPKAAADRVRLTLQAACAVCERGGLCSPLATRPKAGARRTTATLDLSEMPAGRGWAKAPGAVGGVGQGPPGLLSSPSRCRCSRRNLPVRSRPPPAFRETGHLSGTSPGLLSGRTELHLFGNLVLSDRYPRLRHLYTESFHTGPALQITDTEKLL